MEISLTLPWPPSVNHYYARNKNGSVRIDKAGETYRRQVGWLCASKSIKPIEGRLAVMVELMPPDKRRRDLDNSMKCLLDAMQHGGVYDDDSQIDDLHIIRGDKVEGGQVVVMVREVES